MDKTSYGYYGTITRSLVPLEVLMQTEGLSTVGILSKEPGVNLYSENAFAIKRVYVKEGTKFISHKHKPPIVEYIIVISGKYKHIENNKEKILGPQDFWVVKKNIIHEGIALEDTLLVAITVPRDPGYPK